MNRKHLDHDYFTDIITFDYCEGSNVTGDLFISVDRIAENASDLNVALLDELHRVIVHGVLHLIGYSDKGEAAKTQMTSKEDFYLSLRSF
jgi:probable rRNA maturation factor